jgi:hypothetical protein
MSRRLTFLTIKDECDVLRLPNIDRRRLRAEQEFKRPGVS